MLNVTIYYIIINSVQIYLNEDGIDLDIARKAVYQVFPAFLQ